MIKHTLALAAVLAATAAVAAGCGPAPKRHSVALLAIGADASSSGSSGTDFSALKATGQPDVSGCTDSPSAWSPSTANGSAQEFLVLSYERYVHVTDVRIYETFNPGAIVHVDAEASDSHTPPLALFDDPAGDGNPGCPTILHLSVNGSTSDVYDRVAIYFQPSLIGDRNGLNGTADDYVEIDAVEFDGYY